jgi:hypothetical protein
MNTLAPELRALISILRSVGPVISTRRSVSPSTGATRQSPSRTGAVPPGKPGSSPASNAACRSPRLASRSARVGPSSRCSSATSPSASSLRTPGYFSRAGPWTSTPSGYAIAQPSVARSTQVCPLCQGASRSIFQVAPARR